MRIQEPKVRSSGKFNVLVHLIGLFCLNLTLAEPLPRLALNWKPEAQFGGFYAAPKNFEIIPGGSGSPTIQMLAAGRVEYAVVSADEVILAQARGAKDVVALFAVYQTNPQMLMSQASNKYETIEDLFADASGTLLWQAGLPYAQFLIQKRGPLKIKTAPYTGGLGNFKADPKLSQQGFITSEPVLAKKMNISVKTFLVADQGYNPYTTVLVTQKSRLLAKPAEVKKVVESVRQGWNEYLKNPRPINQLLEKLNPANSLEDLNDSAQAQKPLIETDFTQKSGLGRMSSERWQTLVDQLFDLKIIKAKPPVSELFTEL